MRNRISPYQLVGKPKTTAETIVTQANLLFSQCSYDGVSLQAIATACRIKKSSLFYYIKNKAQLAEQVLRRVRYDCQHNLFQEVATTNAFNVTHWFQQLAQFFTTQPSSKLVITLASSIHVTEIRGQLQAYVRQWETEVAALLQPSLEQTVAEQFSQESIERLHGALLMSHIHADDRHIKHCCEALQARYQTLLTTRLN